MNDDPKPGQIIEPGSNSGNTGGNNTQPAGFRPAPNPFETQATASAAPSNMPAAPAAPPPVPPVQPPPPPPVLEPAVSPAETPPTPGSGHPSTPEPVQQPAAAAQPVSQPQSPPPPVQPASAPAVAPTDNPLNTQDPTPAPPPIAQMPTDMVNTEPLSSTAPVPAPQPVEPQAAEEDVKKKKPGFLTRLGLGGKKQEAEKPQPAGPPVPEGTHISWQAPEFVQTHKPVGWYLLVAGFFAVLIALAILTHQWLSIGLFALMGATLAVYANRKPRILNYEMTNNHLMVGQKRYSYGDFSAYYQGHDYNQTVFDLVPNKRFGTLVSLPAPHDMIDQIDEVLAGSLPKTEPHDDAIDKIFRALRF